MEEMELGLRSSSEEESLSFGNNEQEESLLPTGDMKTCIRTNRDRSRLRGVIRWDPRWSSIYLGLSVFVVLILCYLIVRFTPYDSCGLLRTCHTPEFATFRRPQTDYILDPDWNYDAKPTKRFYHFTVSDIMANPDGVFRPMILINGQFPGPMIECNEGDRLVILVDNQSINATSLHWHGLYQNGSNWMDGTVGVTQCPIAPGKTFTYDFEVKGQYGTYWYALKHP